MMTKPAEFSLDSSSSSVESRLRGKALPSRLLSDLDLQSVWSPVAVINAAAICSTHLRLASPPIGRIYCAIQFMASPINDSQLSFSEASSGQPTKSKSARDVSIEIASSIHEKRSQETSAVDAQSFGSKLPSSPNPALD